MRRSDGAVGRRVHRPDAPTKTLGGHDLGHAGNRRRRSDLGATAVERRKRGGSWSFIDGDLKVYADFTASVPDFEYSVTLTPSGLLTIDFPETSFAQPPLWGRVQVQRGSKTATRLLLVHQRAPEPVTGAGSPLPDGTSLAVASLSGAYEMSPDGAVTQPGATSAERPG